MTIIPFQPDLVPEAGNLLALRHQRDRTHLPTLPTRFEDPIVASKAVETSLKRNSASGVAAMDGGRMLGYMIGDLLVDNVWGRSAWVRMAGSALAPDQSVELISELYAVLAERWVSTYGCLDHFILTPIANAALVNAWFMLSFGVQQVYALKVVSAFEASDLPMLSDIDIRKAGSMDREAMADMSDVIWRQQIQAPVWAIMPPENVAETRDGWGEIVDDATAAVFLAFMQGKAVASQCYYSSEAQDDNLLVPDRCAALTVAVTREAFRGQGVQHALTQYALAWLKDNGFEYVEADWRSTNLLASRTWPRHGYQPVAYRLHRRIDPSILWAKGLD